MASTTIASVELLRRRSDEVELHVIDVRTGAEFESAHIPGSHNVPPRHLEPKRARLLHGRLSSGSGLSIRSESGHSPESTG